MNHAWLVSFIFIDTLPFILLRLLNISIWIDFFFWYSFRNLVHRNFKLRLLRIVYDTDILLWRLKIVLVNYLFLLVWSFQLFTLKRNVLYPMLDQKLVLTILARNDYWWVELLLGLCLNFRAVSLVLLCLIRYFSNDFCLFLALYLIFASFNKKPCVV